MMGRVVVIGGGASGLMAAVRAAEFGAVVTILEHKDRVGKKLLMTGNGKCNLTNVSDFHGKYYSSDEKSLKKIYDALSRFGADDTRAFFEGIGLYTKEKQDGGIYPMSEQASCVLDVLRSECSHRGVKIITDCDVAEICIHKHGGAVRYIHHLYEDVGQTQNVPNKKSHKTGKKIWAEDEVGSIAYDCLILAAGSKAAPITGSDGSGYVFAEKLGHRVITPLPALVQLQCEGNFFKSISGVRAKAEFVLYIDGERTACEEGELQLTDYGISGIPVFQFSRVVSRALYEKKKCSVEINFLTQMQEIKMREVTNINRYGYKTVEELLSGMVHKKIASLVCRRHGIAVQECVSEAGKQKVDACIKELRHFMVTVLAVNSFEHAQVCCGGVPLSEVSENFESLKCPDVYLTGELLDCDGICGGYNLQWAWTTGAIAGEASAKSALASLGHSNV